MVQKISFLILLLTAIPAFASDYPIDPAKSHAEFLAIGRPSAIKIKGTKGALTGTANWVKQKLSGAFTVDLNSFETGIATRDHHMKEKYLETGKPGFANAILTIDGLELGSEGKLEINEKKFPAKLKLHGVEKPVELTGAFKSDGKNLSGSTKFKIKLSDFAIAIPSFSGITVAEDVDLSVDFEANKK